MRIRSTGATEGGTDRDERCETERTRSFGAHGTKNMSDMSFTWRGESSDQHGVVVRSLPPIYSPQLRDEPIPIPGRHGSLHQQDGAYDEQLMMIEGYLPYEQSAPVSDIETIKGWLRGYGDLTLSDRPGRRYKARIVDAIAFSPWVVGFADRIFAVSFWCDPFAYEADPDVQPITGPYIFDNIGTLPADPLIVVYGTGRVVFTVGDISITMDNMSSPVTIDCEGKAAYLGDGVDGARTSITLDQHAWPVFELGSTRVSWTGHVSKAIVTPKWRWL